MIKTKLKVYQTNLKNQTIEDLLSLKASSHFKMLKTKAKDGFKLISCLRTRLFFIKKVNLKDYLKD